MIDNLLRIAEKAGLDLNEEQQFFFSTVTGFTTMRGMMTSNSHFTRNAHGNFQQS